MRCEQALAADEGTQRWRRQDPTMKAAGSDDEGDGGGSGSGDCGIRRWRIGSRSCHGGIRDNWYMIPQSIGEIVQAVQSAN